ncbi:MAG: nucleotidyltransferase domain-containing protein, partial [Clostridia bacterium]|nr:nucleotidyltransferase domain-containing protein [Clostridia bacterium]
MSEKVYTIEEIKELICDILRKYGIEKAYIFGSYARGEANKQSDIDIMIKKGKLKTLLQLSALAYEIEQILKKQIDIVVEETYTDDIQYDSETIKLAKNIFY